MNRKPSFNTSTVATARRAFTMIAGNMLSFIQDTVPGAEWLSDRWNAQNLITLDDGESSTVKIYVPRGVEIRDWADLINQKCAHHPKTIHDLQDTHLRLCLWFLDNYADQVPVVPVKDALAQMRRQPIPNQYNVKNPFSDGQPRPKGLVTA